MAHGAVEGPLIRQKHVPIRTCVACGAKLPKLALVRVVHTPSGEVMVDPTGKQSGRGAYLCHDPACWQRMMKGDRIARALRTQLPEDGRRRLVASGTAALKPEPQEFA